MSQTMFDLIIIGAGPGGYVAAIRASQLGLKTAIIESKHLGGICLNWGCIPTKALLKSAELYKKIEHASDYGINVGNVSFDIKKIVERSRNVSSQLSGGIAHLMKKNKITVFDGYGRVGKKNANNLRQVTVTTSDKKTQALEAKNVIIATGATPRILPGLEPDGKLIWTSKEAMIPETMPKNLLVIGSGAIGIEFASFYKTLGAKVTVVELQSKILPQEDDEISKLAQKAFEAQGITFFTQSSTSKIEKKGDAVNVTIKTPKGDVVETFDRIISAVGITANTNDLGLENTSVKIDRGQIIVDGYCATNEPGIYAIGDVAGAPWLAHKASHEGILCVEKIAGSKDVHTMNRSNIPGCTYSIPQVASIGLTETAALEKGYKIKVGRFPFMGNGKAIAMGEKDGLIKTIFDEKTGELLGAHMIGADVTELIQGFGIAKTLETTEKELMDVIFPHPTLSEMMHESVLDAYKRVIHF